MNKIMLIVYYELIEYLAVIGKALMARNYNVCYYPLFRYAFDKHDKKADVLDHFNDFINDEQPDIVIWFFIDVPLVFFNSVILNNKNTYFIVVNFSEPVNITHDLLNKISYFDLLITSHQEYSLMYKKYAKDILYNPYGVDTHLFCTTNDVSEKYNCDISIVYHHDADRQDVVQEIIKYCTEKNKILKIYGIPLLGDIFNEHYCGELAYTEKYLLFNCSKINICFFSDDINLFSYEENMLEIMACGGLILTDNCCDEFIDKYNVVYMEDDYIGQIDNILLNYGEYATIKKNALDITANRSWDIWVETLHTYITKKLFNSEIYGELNNIEPDCLTYEHWLENGKVQNHICKIFNVPERFNYEDYAKHNNLAGKSKYYSYFHWNNSGKNKFYIGTNKNMSFNVLDCNVSYEDFFELCTYFNKADEDLIKIFVDRHPYCDINKLLEFYYGLTQ